MLIVGTSGWQYRDWKGPFYPKVRTPGGLAPQATRQGTPHHRPRGADLLPYYTDHFATVELNNSFYRLPPYETFARWRTQVPQDFVFAVKMSRYLTHIKRLRDPQEPVSLFLRHAAGLGDKLGPILLQLPPTLRFDPELLHAMLGCFPDSARVAVEPRHPTWFSTQVRQALEKHGAALRWADRLSRPITPLWQTTDFGYVRLHEGRAKPRPHYGRAALSSWLDRVTSVFADAPVYIYFNNDPGCAAVFDAVTLAGLAQRRDIPVTRTPSPDHGQP